MIIMTNADTGMEIYRYRRETLVVGNLINFRDCARFAAVNQQNQQEGQHDDIRARFDHHFRAAGKQFLRKQVYTRMFEPQMGNRASDKHHPDEQKAGDFLNPDQGIPSKHNGKEPALKCTSSPERIKNTASTFDRFIDGAKNFGDILHRLFLPPFHK